MNVKQIAIEALEEAIEFAEKQLDNLKDKLDKLNVVQAEDDKPPVKCIDGQVYDPILKKCVDNIG